MPAKTKCSICRGTANLAVIDSLIDSSSMTLKEISEQFHISVYSLSRHSRHRNNPALEDGSASSDLQSKSDLLWERSNEIWALAAADADLRSQISSIQTGLRSLELQAKQAERNREIAEEAGEADGKVSINSLDDVLSFLSPPTEPDPVDAKKLEEALRRCRALNGVDGVQIFYRMMEDNRFCSDLVSYATNWTPKEKGSNEPVQTESAAN